MITFLWMLYLTLTLIMSVVSLITLVEEIIILYNENEHEYKSSPLIRIFPIIITCYLWSIWYFYYLN